jgi:hypothetical protein
MRTAIENAGAERGLLFLSRGPELHVEAEAVTGGDGIIVRLADTLVDPPAAPESIINYVGRTQETIILDDAQNPVSADRHTAAFFTSATIFGSSAELRSTSYMLIGPTSIATRHTSSLKCLPAENFCTSSMTS